MTNYDLINDNLSLIVKMINNGLMKINTVEHLEMYEDFLSMTGTRIERYKALAKQYNYHYRYVQKVILKMQKRTK